MGRNSSMPNFNNLNENRKKSEKESIKVYKTFNLPILRNKNFFTKSNLDESINSNAKLIKINNDYNNFYNIYHEDKNFYLGVEFQKKFKKEFKYVPLPKKDNILKI